MNVREPLSCAPAETYSRAMPKRFVRLGLVAVVIVIAGIAVLTALVQQRFNAPGAHEDSVTVLISKGASLKRVAETLEAAGAISNARLFRRWVQITGSDDVLKAGEYAIPPRASMAQILDQMRRGEVVLRRLTVAEGLTSAQVTALIAVAEGLDGAIEAPPEGALLPETYYYTYGDTRSGLARRMETAQAEFIDAVWPDRAPDLPFRSADEALILASIVEKETAVPSERARIAAVFVNRLKRNMRLQSDPTVIYGISGGEALGRPIRQSELDRATPYNTYVNRGLPPTPIANPGRESILAVLHPAATQDLYFVADGTGGHAFASTLAEHNRNVAKWRRIQRERSID